MNIFPFIGEVSAVLRLTHVDALLSASDSASMAGRIDRERQ